MGLNEYITRTGGGEYQVIFKTDDPDNYHAVEDYCRDLIHHGKRKHGTWLECEMLDGTILYQCSCCSQDWFVPDISLIKYCPMCGAEMEGEYS